MSIKTRTNPENLKSYHILVQNLRSFFLSRGFIEVATQPNLTILSACENPHSVATFSYVEKIWPLPQTGQMILEEVLLNNPEIPGCFCISTSYRQEQNPIPGRHELIFPMFEFESKGDIKDLFSLEADLLAHLGFPFPVRLDYDNACEEYGGVPILENEHEQRMWEELGPVVSLENFPLRTHPFWNMKQCGNGVFNKIDMILFGQETIGSAERSCSREEMKHNFYHIEDGKYCARLFELFGRDRVEEELEDFLSLEFFPRFGGGIGLTRLARAWQLLNAEKKPSARTTLSTSLY